MDLAAITIIASLISLGLLVWVIVTLARISDSARRTREMTAILLRIEIQRARKEGVDVVDAGSAWQEATVREVGLGPPAPTIDAATKAHLDSMM